MIIKDLYKLACTGIPGYNPLKGYKVGHAKNIAELESKAWKNHDYVFVDSLARHSIEFMQALKHCKGIKAGEAFLLEPWQQAENACLFGFLRRLDGGLWVRRYRKFFGYVPRKNGKSPRAATFIIYMLFCDQEPGAEIYGAASETGQAEKVFDHVKGMIRQNETLSSKCRIYDGQAKSIQLTSDGSTYKVVSSTAGSKDGQNTHCYVLDELHRQEDRELIDVLESSTSARTQPLAIYITTADCYRPSICNEMYDYACSVRDGLVPDGSFLPSIYEASIDDDPHDEKTWYKANPNLGVSKSIEYMREQSDLAKALPGKLNAFLRFDLNIRTKQEVRWGIQEHWDDCVANVDERAIRELLKGRACWAGLDIASNQDLTALARLFKLDAVTMAQLGSKGEGSGYFLLTNYWCPEDQIALRRHARQVGGGDHYRVWAEQGYIKITDGPVTDYEIVRSDILTDASIYRYQEIAIDRLFQGAETCKKLSDEGMNVVPFGQGFLSMASPVTEFENLVLGKRILHTAHPVTDWMISNVALELDAAGNRKPSKKKSSDKIDGAVATLMALGRAVLSNDSLSKYESEEPVVF